MHVKTPFGLPMGRNILLGNILSDLFSNEINPISGILFLTGYFSGSKSDLCCGCLHCRHVKLSEMNHTPALLPHSDFSFLRRMPFRSKQGEYERMLSSSLPMGFFGFIYITSSVNPTSVLSLTFRTDILAKFCDTTSDFFGRRPILYFTCFSIGNIACKPLCPNISRYFDYFYVVLFEMYHKYNH